MHGRPPDERGTNPKGEGACPPRYLRPQGVACPPQRRRGAPCAGTPTTVAGCAQGQDPERRTRVSCGSGHWGRVAKTTRVETVYHRGYAVKVTIAMKDTMEAKDWTPELPVCCRPPDTLPSDTRLHYLLVPLLGVQVQVNAPLHPQLWDNHRNPRWTHTGNGPKHRQPPWSQAPRRCHRGRG